MARDKRRSDRMRSIEALADREAKDLAAKMARQARALEAAEARLAELTGYLTSYREEQATRSANGGVTGMRLNETRLFLAKLTDAVRLQETVVAKARTALEACRARWIAQHVRTSALGSVVHRFVAEEEREARMREQRQQDEVAARYHRPPELE